MEIKKFKINFFDIVIALVVIAVIGGIYLFTNKEKVVETKKIVYTLELNNLPEGLTENIKVGDKAIFNIYPGYIDSSIRREYQ